MSIDELIIEGARQNNLKNISLTLPHNRVIAVTGVSGSGKSSLAFDTIFAEGQWRFIESLSTYARLFLEKIDRPDVDTIRNIRPAIALEQVNHVKGSRSTVGTLTEIYDYLRLLYSKIGRPNCPVCGTTLRAWDPSSVVGELVGRYPGRKALIVFETEDSADELLSNGFQRILVDGEIVDISLRSGPVPLGGAEKRPPVQVVLDRIVIRDEHRLADSVESAWKNGRGKVRIRLIGDRPEEDRTMVFHSDLRCPECDIGIARPQPLLFSFNHPLGACPECKGFGNILEYTEDSVVPDRQLSIKEGAIEPWSKPAYRWWFRQLKKVAKDKGIRLTVPYTDLSRKERSLIFRGDDDFYGVKDFFDELEKKRYKLHVRVFLSRYRRPVMCGRCGGSRIRPEALAFTVGDLNIAGMAAMSLSEMETCLSGLKLTQYEREISSEILRQIGLKINFLMRTGLGYLTIDRLAKTLSGGEYQRINLANQLSSRLAGTLYVLDEPTIGLHPRDVHRITEIVRELADIGNTIIAVEHDRTVIESSDWVVELGPGGGKHGGAVVYSGQRQNFLQASTLTADYLGNRKAIEVPRLRRRGSGRVLSMKGAKGNNLKNITFEIPLQTLICVTGVSGSGKSTLVKDTLYNAVAGSFRASSEPALPFESLTGVDHIEGIRIIDQQPIGRSPRSNPITYIKAFDPIRKIFAEQFRSRSLGYGPGHFSFNNEEGRCESCKGDGLQKLEMYFFEDLYITCEECNGRRYKPGILTVTYRGKNIHEVLALTVEEALQFFSDQPALTKKLKLMASVGLGYLRLGQPATTLSGGEAQRVKICSELGIARQRGFLYILDEPTVGLHPDDIRKLIRVLTQLVDAGNTVLAVEHNPDVIKCADWIVDLGPEGGEEGGYIVAQGTPEEIVEQKNSYTGRFLRKYLA